jgi:hypothetical protein
MVRFRIDPDRCAVVIAGTVKRRPFERRVGGLEGFVDLGLDPDGSVDVATGAAAELILPATELRGRNPLETRELRRRIHAGRFPALGARLETVRESGVDGSCIAVGQVTVRGRTCRAEDTVRLTLVDPGTLRIEGAHTFDVRAFGVDPPRVLGGHLDPVVRVRVDLIARRDD